MQACANLFIHNCATTTGQSGSSMWDSDFKIRSLSIGKVSGFDAPSALFSFQTPLLEAGRVVVIRMSVLQEWLCVLCLKS